MRGVDARSRRHVDGLTEFESGCLREVDGVRWFDLGVNVALATDRLRRAACRRRASMIGLPGGWSGSELGGSSVTGVIWPNSAFAMIFVRMRMTEPMSIETAPMVVGSSGAHAVVGADERQLAAGVRGCISPDQWPQTAFSDLRPDERLDTIAPSGSTSRLAAATGGCRSRFVSSTSASPRGCARGRWCTPALRLTRCTRSRFDRSAGGRSCGDPFRARNGLWMVV